VILPRDQLLNRLIQMLEILAELLGQLAVEIRDNWPAPGLDDTRLS
jgi:hypothetical protein